MKRIQVTHVSPSCVVVGGHGSRDLVMKILVRTPVFASGNPRGWVMQPHRVPDLLAVAEARGYDVEVFHVSRTGHHMGGPSVPSVRDLTPDTHVSPVADVTPQTAELADPGRGLW